MEGTSIPVRRSRARTQAVANRIRQQILSGAWANGHLLPSERDMASQFSIARNTLRRIIQQLESEGLIESHPGRGSVVRLSPLGDQMSRAEVMPTTAHASQAELLEMRALLEPLVAALAATRATPEEISAMEAAHRKAVEEPVTLEHWVAELHHAIWRAAGNAALLDWYEAVDRQLPRRTVAADVRASCLQNLAALVAALRDQDRDLARDLMRNLLRKRETPRPLLAVDA